MMDTPKVMGFMGYVIGAIWLAFAIYAFSVGWWPLAIFDIALAAYAIRANVRFNRAR